ncbi:MAG: hypothetical protein QNJ22_02685 [Desulfosarcinaceae bacterium]|nr:hypothetical protein [Desulfosarcinaceae bacterium]
MANDPQTQAYQAAWHQLRRAAQALEQAGELVREAHTILDRFCSGRDQDNWDRAFPWRIRELLPAGDLCREVARHIQEQAALAADGESG